MTTQHEAAPPRKRAKAKAAHSRTRTPRVSTSVEVREIAQAPLPVQAIAEAAYYKAERRGFAPGFDVDDWLEAERELRAAQQTRHGKRARKPTTTARGADAGAALPA